MTSVVSPGTAQPSSKEAIERFIASKTEPLEAPLVFGNNTDKFVAYLCCGPAGWLGTLGIGALFALPIMPVALCCPQKLSRHYLLLVSPKGTMHAHVRHAIARARPCMHPMHMRPGLATSCLGPMPLESGRLYEPTTIYPTSPRSARW